MNEAEFLELLNLYLDHEISPADAARLEAEVQRSPDRRRTYLEYCRMQKACAVLAKDFAEQPADKKALVVNADRAGWSGGWMVAGSLAAAACVAFVFSYRSANHRQLEEAPGAQAVAVSVAAAGQTADLATSIPSSVGERLPGGSIARTVTVPVRRGELKPVFVASPLNPGNPESQFGWMQGVQISPMQGLPEREVRLDPRSPLQPARRTYTSGRPVQGSVEMTAFRFQK